jgi:hypothetical protein
MLLLRPATVAVLLAVAPLQCGHTPEAELQEDETPGDALWMLAQTFHAEHRDAAERQTLEFLVERYPASRWAAPARDRLAAMDGAGAAGAGAVASDAGAATASAADGGC